MELKVLAQKITELQNQHTDAKKGGGKVVTKEGKKIQFEIRAQIDALPEIEEDMIMDDALENFVGEEFRVLSY